MKKLDEMMPDLGAEATAEAAIATARTSADARTKAGSEGLYAASHEHDACGVGFVADIKGRKSHSIVKDALYVLENLEHRGAVGADPLMGDGAGVDVACHAAQAGEPLQRLGDVVLLEARGGQLAVQQLAFRTGVGVDVALEEVYEDVEQGGLSWIGRGGGRAGPPPGWGGGGSRPLFQVMRWKRPPGSLARRPSSSSGSRMA